MDAAERDGPPDDPAGRILATLALPANEVLDVDLVGLAARIDDARLRDHLLGLTAMRLGDVIQARRLFERVHDADPMGKEAAEALALCYARLGRPADSLYFAKLGTAGQIRYPDLDLLPDWLGSFEAAFLFMDESPTRLEAERALAAGSYNLAFQKFSDAIELDRSDWSAWRGLTETALASGRLTVARRAAEALTAARPDAPEDRLLAARVFAASGDAQSAQAAVEAAMALAPRHADTGARLLALMPGGDGMRGEVLALLAKAWRDRYPPPSAIPAAGRIGGEGLRVGILSGALDGTNPWPGLISTMEECLSRVAETYYYATMAREDVVSRRLKRAATRWTSLAGIDDETAATIIGNDQLDVLIYLDGFADFARPSLARLAPTGLVLQPFASPGATVSERALVLADGAFAVAPEAGLHVAEGLSTWPLYGKARARARARAPDSASGPVFGLDCPPGAVGPAMLACLRDILARDPEARLYCRGDWFGDLDDWAAFLIRLKGAGLDIDRVAASDHGHASLDFVDRVDVVLDSFPRPNSGGLIEALRTGCPVVTPRPDLAENAASASLISGLGLEALMAEGPEDYVAKALAATRPEAARDMSARIAQAIDTAAGLAPREARAQALRDGFKRLLEERER